MVQDPFHRWMLRCHKYRQYSLQQIPEHLQCIAKVRVHHQVEYQHSLLLLCWYLPHKRDNPRNKKKNICLDIFDILSVLTNDKIIHNYKLKYLLTLVGPAGPASAPVRRIACKTKIILDFQNWTKQEDDCIPL